MNVDWNVIGTLRLKLLPDTVAVAPPTFTLHWLFCNVPELPIIMPAP